MTREEHLLVKVTEECGETAQRAAKALCFGMTEAQSPDHSSNAVRLVEEYNDLVSIMEILFDIFSIGRYNFYMFTSKFRLRKTSIWKK